MKRLANWLIGVTLFFAPILTYSQNTVGIGTEDPNPNAVLELVSPNNNQGILVPRLTTNQRLAINGLTNDDNGLMVYDLNQNEFFYWHSGEWHAIISLGAESGGINAGEGLELVGNELTNTGDLDSTNEIQTLSLDENNLSISGTEGVIDLSDFRNSIENQQSNEVAVEPTGGLTSTTVQDALVELQEEIEKDADTAPDNEIQDLTLENNVLKITENDQSSDIDLSPYLDNTDDQTLSFDGRNLLIEDGNLVDLVSLQEDADADPENEIQDLSLTNNDLTITNNSSATQIDLEPYLDNTDDQTATEVPVTPDGNLSSVNVQFALIELQEDIDNDLDEDPANEIQDLDLINNELFITNNASRTLIDLQPYLDNTDDQQLGLTGDNLALEDGGSVDLSEYVKAGEGNAQLINDALYLVDGDLNGIREDVSAVESRVTTAETDIDNLETGLGNAEGRIGVNETNISGIDGRLGTAETDIDNLETGLGNAEVRIENNETGISGLDTRVTTAETDITNLESGLTSAEGRIGVNEADIDNLETGLGNAETRIGDNESNISGLDGRLGTAETNIVSNDADIAGLRTDLTAAEGRIGTAEGDIDALEAQNYVFVGDGNALLANDALYLVDADLNGIRTDVANVEGRVTAAEGNISSNDTDIAGLRTDLTTAEGRITTNESNIGGLNGRLTTAEGNISDNNTDIGNNAANISGNTAAIGANTALIGTNTAAIATNLANIGSNTASIGTNTAAIGVNSNRIDNLSTADISDISDAGSGAIITDAERTKVIASITDLNSFTTTDLNEGTNLYYTDGRVSTVIGASSVTELNDVIDAGSGAIITNDERTKLEGDDDSDPANEIQFIQLGEDNTLSLTTDSGDGVNLSSFLDNTDNQQLGSSSDELGPFITLTGSDADVYFDPSPTNEIQSLAFDTDNTDLLEISRGNSVDLSRYTNTDNQSLSLDEGDELSLTDGGSVLLSTYRQDIESSSDEGGTFITLSGSDQNVYFDASNSNELQDLESGFDTGGDFMTLSNSTDVVYFDPSSTNEIQDLSYNSDDDNFLEISNGSGVNLSKYLDNTDNQAAVDVDINPITGLAGINDVQGALEALNTSIESTDGTDDQNSGQVLLQSSIPGLSGASNVQQALVGLSGFDNSATNEIQELQLIRNELSLTSSLNGPIDLSGYLNTDQQNLALEGFDLNITNGTGVILTASNVEYNEGNVAGALNSLSVELSGINTAIGGLDNSATNEIQDLALEGFELSISDGTGVNLTASNIEYNEGNVAGALNFLSSELSDINTAIADNSLPGAEAGSVLLGVSGDPDFWDVRALSFNDLSEIQSADNPNNGYVYHFQFDDLGEPLNWEMGRLEAEQIGYDSRVSNVGESLDALFFFRNNPNITNAGVADDANISVSKLESTVIEEGEDVSLLNNDAGYVSSTVESGGILIEDIDNRLTAFSSRIVRVDSGFPRNTISLSLIPAIRDGQELILINVGVGLIRVQETASGNLILPNGSFDMATTNSLHLIYDQNSDSWIEISRTPVPLIPTR